MSQSLAKDCSRCQEDRIARLLGGKVQANSGGTRFGGGDVHTKDFFIEAKTPTKDQTSFSIQLNWIIKMREQAFEQNKPHAALAFSFSPDGPDYFIIDGPLMQDLVKLMQDQNL